MANNKYDPTKKANLDLVRKKYLELKGKRNELRSIHLNLIEEELQGAKDSFAELLQEVYEADGANYKVTIADLMNAMGTTSRNTVHGYLKDARMRKQNSWAETTIKVEFEIVEIEEDTDAFYATILDTTSDTKTLLFHEIGKWYIGMRAWNPERNVWSQKKDQLDYDGSFSGPVPDAAAWFVTTTEFKKLWEKYA